MNYKCDRCSKEFDSLVTLAEHVCEPVKIDIDSMPAGREMDALVAEKVFGMVRCQAECHQEGVHAYIDGRYCYALPESPDQGGQLRQYSTSISAAWEVVEKMREIMVIVSVCYDDAYKGWKLAMRGYMELVNWNYWPWADTAPLAICRAALKAVGKEEG